MILCARHSVIVGVAFLRRAQRVRPRAVAEQEHAVFVILDIQAPESVLHAHLLQRQRQKNEASEAGLTVFQHQLTTREPLSDDERGHALTIDGAKTVIIAELERQLQARLASA